MKPVVSAGLLMYKINQGAPEILLGHPGGPYYVDCDEGVWSIPKGQVEHGETLLDTAIREFSEETGWQPPTSGLITLGHIATTKKQIHIWAFVGNCDASQLCSNPFWLEWPPRSGKRGAFPEVDRMAYFDTEATLIKILPSQVPLIRETLVLLDEAD